MAPPRSDLRNVFFSLDGIYSDARERWNTEIDLRPRRKQIGYGASALVKVAWKTSFSLAYRTAKYDYESVEADGGFNVRERLNRRESYGNFSLFYQLATERRLFLDFEYGLYRFEFPTQAALGIPGACAAYAGFEFSQLGRRIRGRIRLGYKKFDVRAAEGLDFQGFVGDSQLSSGWQDPSPSGDPMYEGRAVSLLWYGNPYYVMSQSGSGGFALSVEIVRLDYDYSIGRNRYPVVGGGGPDVKRLDEYTIHSAGIYFRIMKTTALGFIASWWARESNLVTENDKRTFFGLNLTYDF